MTTFDVLEPATSLLLARVAECGTAEVDEAVRVADGAFAEWRAMPVSERADAIRAFARRIENAADDLAMLDARDTGSPVTAMRADVAKGVRQLQNFAGVGQQLQGATYPLPGLHYSMRRPWGVVAAIIAFNHPALYTCSRLGAALIAGNCVLIKPSKLAPLAPLAIGELTRGILPDGVVSIVTGGKATGSAIARHPGVRRIAVTGSTGTGLLIQSLAAESGSIKRVSLELGGKNPIVVFPDVDIDEASSAIARGMNFTRVQGQSCGATSRVLVHRDIAPQIVDRVVEQVASIRIGDPLDPATEMGALIDMSSRDRCLGIVADAQAAGARLEIGGAVPTGSQYIRGAFLEPTVLSGVGARSRIFDEEVFGPVMAITEFADEDEGIRLANEGPYGLTAAVWTADIDRAFRVAEAIDAGYLWINDVEIRYPGVPFGGWGDSGVDVENGMDEVLSYTRLKAVNVRIRQGAAGAPG